MTTRIPLLTVLALALLGGEAEARRARLPLPKRVEQAATIVVGKVTKVAKVKVKGAPPFYADGMHAATLEVRRVLKGSSPATVHVLYSTVEQRPALGRFKLGEEAIVFLRAGRLEKKYAQMIVYYPDGKAPLTDLAKVRQLTTAWFAWRLHGKHTGYFRMRAEQVLGQPAPWRMSFRFSINFRGQKMALDMEVHGKDDAYRTPVRIVSKGTGGEFASFDAKIAWPAGGQGAATVTRPDGTTRRNKLPWPVVDGFTLFHMVQGRPFDAKQVLTFHSLEVPFHLKKDHQLKYLGAEELPIWGKATSLHKFEQRGGGISPLYLWVDKQRRLVRVIMDRRKEYLRTSEKAARKGID